jgi:glycosyltransferase involved in cell wall biosynthesis
VKILHLFSNWKWTGPAEHAVNAVVCLRKRGEDVTLACAPPPAEAGESLLRSAKERGITPYTGLRLNKHFNILHNFFDALKLRHFLKQEPFHLLHAHLTNDHFLAGIAAGRHRKIKVVRSCYDGGEVERDWLSRLLYSRFTDGVICVSERSRRSLLDTFFFPADRVWTIPVPVDCERFTPEKRSQRMRERYGIQESDVVAGIVARVQPHRRFDVLLSAAALTIEKVPNFKLMIVGRGTHLERVAKRPVEHLGISRQVIFTGYREDDYAETLACMDMKVFLVPGTDGACRAVREAMATGIPVIAARRGMLPEIIDDGTNGLIIDDTPENVSQALLRLILNPSMRKEMGGKARSKAVSQFSLSTFGETLAQVYRTVVGP